MTTLRPHETTRAETLAGCDFARTGTVAIDAAAGLDDTVEDARVDVINAETGHTR